jgi:hypothetical protein
MLWPNAAFGACLTLSAIPCGCPAVHGGAKKFLAKLKEIRYIAFCEARDDVPEKLDTLANLPHIHSVSQRYFYREEYILWQQIEPPSIMDKSN